MALRMGLHPSAAGIDQASLSHQMFCYRITCGSWCDCSRTSHSRCMRPSHSANPTALHVLHAKWRYQQGRHVLLGLWHRQGERSGTLIHP